MSRERKELMEYRHQLLMNDLNEFMIAVKTHLYNLPVAYNKPTIQEIDAIHRDLMDVLRQDAKPMRRY